MVRKIINDRSYYLYFPGIDFLLNDLYLGCQIFKKTCFNQISQFILNFIVTDLWKFLNVSP